MKPVPELQPPDTHYLNAALGWLGLGQPREALAELDGLSPEAQQHPGVLNLRWGACVELRDWPAALHAARCLVAVVPDQSSTWLHLAYALRRVPEGGLAAATEVLRPACGQFPQDAIIPYNLACYACQSGDLEAARGWLGEAIRRGGLETIQRMAAADEDLRPLWTEIQSMGIA